MSDVPANVKVERAEMSDDQVKELENKLDAVFGAEPRHNLPNEDNQTESEVVSESEVVEPQETAATPPDVEAADENPDAPGADPEPADESPTLPPNYRRSLIAKGWTNEEIDEQYAALGEEFEKVARKVHESRVAESREWAAHGRRAQERDQAETASPQQIQSQTGEGVTPQLSRIDANRLKEKYGNDAFINELIDELTGPINQTVEQVNSILPTIAQSQLRQQEADDAALSRQVEGFFGSREVSGFRRWYGSGDTRNMDPASEEFQNRMMLLQTADALRVGAAYQGRDLSIDESLALAHESVSGEWKTQALREELANKVKQRAKSVTLRPNAAATKTTEGIDPQREVTRSELEAKATAALRQIFPG